jgi:hypothetical protein
VARAAIGRCAGGPVKVTLNFASLAQEIDGKPGTVWDQAILECEEKMAVALKRLWELETARTSFQGLRDRGVEWPGGKRGAAAAEKIGGGS